MSGRGKGAIAGPALLVLALLTLSGCATLHPRLDPDLKEGPGGIEKVALLWPDIDVRMKYYNTDVYVYSAAESVRISRAFGESLRNSFEGKGFETTLVPREGADSGTGRAWQAGTSENCDDSRQPVMPDGLVRDSRRCGDSPYERRIRRAEQLFLEVITMDPGYTSKAVPETLRFEAPAGDLDDYDLVVIVYGAMREETETESFRRWVKNLTVNAAMVPMSMASIIFPFALPITISMPFFLDTSPDISWVALVAFEPKAGRVVFLNDFFYSRGKIKKAIERGAAKLVKGFPERTGDEPPRRKTLGPVRR